jgi:hypothetical protein
VQNDAGFRRKMLGNDFAARAGGLGSRGFQGLPADAEPLVKDLVELRALEKERPAGVPRSLVREEKAATVRQLKDKAGAHARAQDAAALRDSVERVDEQRGIFRRDGNLLVDGYRLVHGFGHAPIRHIGEQDGTIALQVGGDTRGGELLLETEDGLAIPAVTYPRLSQLIVRQGRSCAIGYGRRGGNGPLDQAFDAIADFVAGKLGPADLDRLAARLRWAKHVDPVLGVISAYLYRATADFDSIRRMAYFYLAHEQPVPFDIVLLGQMPVRRGSTGALRVEIPPVEARAGGHAGLPDFVTQETPSGTAKVGGRCPWLAIGWDYVADPRREWAPLVAGLAGYAHSVPRSGFTVLPAAAGRELAQRWRLIWSPL